MPQFTKLTPNLIVSDVSRSVAFYVDVLGFSRGMTVPDHAPFVFASVSSGPIEIFFNDRAAAAKEYPALAAREPGASGTLFIEVQGIEAFYQSLQGAVTVTCEFCQRPYRFDGVDAQRLFLSPAGIAGTDSVN